MKRLPLLLLFLLAAWLPGLVQAQESAIRLLGSAAQGDFPQSITFTLEAESSSPITQVTLQFRVQRASCVPSLATEKPSFTSGPRASVSWKWELKKVGGLPPGSQVEFRWQIEDSGGSRLTTEWQLFEFQDQRFQWLELKGEGLTLLWYRGDVGFAQELVTAGEAALERLAREADARLREPARLFIYGSSEELRQALIFSAEWTGGQAFTTSGLIALGIPPEALEWGRGAVAHELAHLVIGALTFNCYADLPTWLSEGLAVYAEGEASAYNIAKLQSAVAQDQLISVQSLGGSFPADSAQANLAYAQSRSLVAFLIERYRPEKMRELLLAFQEGSRYDPALKRVYGFDTEGLDAAWRAWLGLGPRPIPTLAPSPTPTPAIAATPTPRAGGGSCQASFRSGGGWGASLAVLAGLVLPPAAQLWLQGRRKTRQQRDIVTCLENSSQNQPGSGRPLVVSLSNHERATVSSPRPSTSSGRADFG